MQQAKLNGEDYDISGKVITDMPDNFKSWAIDNAERIAECAEVEIDLFDLQTGAGEDRHQSGPDLQRHLHRSQGLHQHGRGSLLCRQR